MEWTEYWQNLLHNNKLTGKVEDLDEYEKNILQKEPQTERICKGIYEQYDAKEKELLCVKQDCLNELDSIEGIHLSCGRVKKKDSLLCKVIKKRSENIAAFDNKYYVLDEFCYDKIITDLVGLRLIISYRGEWLSVHQQILERFPLLDRALYQEKELLQHGLAKQFQAEWPKVYYAKGDSIQEYVDEGLITQLKKSGYRSFHYILSYEKTYIELQLRTIYDEAWSECDHNYVYKKDNHLSHGALAEMSGILNTLTNVAGTLNDIMKSVYDSQGMTRNAQRTGWITQAEHVKDIDALLEKLKDTDNYFKQFREKLISKQEDCNETS